MTASYINPALPSMIRGLYKADLREKSIQNMLDLAADLVQELIDTRAQADREPSEWEWRWVAWIEGREVHKTVPFPSLRQAEAHERIWLMGQTFNHWPSFEYQRRRRASEWEPVENTEEGTK